jgi:hypothetical protein
MQLHDYFARLLAYDDWANRQTLTALQAAPSNQDREVRFLAHVIAAEQLWLARLNATAGVNPPIVDFAHCTRLGLLD